MAEEKGGLVFHPMDQFIVKPLFGDGAIGMFTVTNMTLWLALAAFCTIGLMVIGTSGRAVIPGRAQSIAELAYGFVYKMVEDVTGKDGIKYFPYIFTLFIFILFSNFLALIPMSFSPTSHIAVTAILGFGVFFVVTAIGFIKNGVRFPGPLLGRKRTFGAASGSGIDRGDLLLRAPCQPLHSSRRQRHGGPRGS